MRDQREWRTSKIGPFAGNIFFVLANLEEKFGGGLSCDSAQEQRVLLFVNEVETPIPGCGDGNGVCTLADLQAMHGAGRWGQGQGEASCNFEEICRNEEGAASNTRRGRAIPMPSLKRYICSIIYITGKYRG